VFVYLSAEKKCTMEKQFLYQQKAIKGDTTWLLFLLFGWSYGSMDNIGKQIFYYLTLAGLGLWFFYRLITLNSAIKKYNRRVALECGFSFQEIGKMGLI
jgi:hypothetical protein